MKLNPRFIMAAALCAGLFAAVAPRLVLADATQDTIQGYYDAQCKAAIAGDVKGMEKYMSPDYVSIDTKGVQENRKKAIADMTAGMAQLSVSDCKTKIQSFTVAGDTATVTAKQTVDGIAPSASVAPINIVGVSTDVWTKQPDGSYLNSKSTLIKQTVSVNGQVVQQEGGVR